MRKCDFDKPLKAIISINCDIVIIFLLIYLVAVILACNEQSLELQGEGGGGGDMGAGADGGGLTLMGSTNKTFNWINATDAFTASEHISIAAGKEYRIGGVK